MEQRRVEIQVQPHPRANADERWQLSWLFEKARVADHPELRLKFVEKITALNGEVEDRISGYTPMFGDGIYTVPDGFQVTSVSLVL